MIQESLPPLLHPTNILMGSNKKVGVEEDDIPDYDASDLPIVPRDEEPYGQLVSDKFNNFFDLVGNVSKKSSENVSENVSESDLSEWELVWCELDRGLILSKLDNATVSSNKWLQSFTKLNGTNFLL